MTTPSPNRSRSSEKNPKKAGQTAGHPSFQQFKLISVDFKEAALDSPSFRASVNHLDTQVDNIEKWLLAIISTVGKFPRYVKELKTFSDSFLEHLSPTFLQDGLIEQEYTVQSLQTVTEGMHKLWDMALSVLMVTPGPTNMLRMVLKNEIQQYKQLRAKFESLQQKYDRYLSIYQSTPKIKDPSIVMEDAYQLYEVRREYIHVCIDLSVELTNLGHTLDRMFVSLTTELWQSKHQAFEKFIHSTKYFQASMQKVNRIKSWCDSNDLASEKLSRDMNAARVQVENSTSLQFQPSNNLNDYRASLINNSILADIDEQALEKHGYLFMKTWRGGSTKPTWVRRWAFIKCGVFGLLNLSPSNNFVQESDKIGLLVCNVKFAAYEERRYCFEIKTVDSTFLFQCETVLELKSWLKVFQNEKERVLSSKNEHGSNLLAIASGRYPPILKELASTVNTKTDKQLTSGRIVNNMGQVIASSRLSAHIEKNERDFQKHVYYELLQIRPPFITDSTKSAILAYSLVEPTAMPTALTANIWGSINWGLYYLHDATRENATVLDRKSEVTPPEPSSSGGSESGVDVDYPPNYPKAMYPKDIQMRALFETAVEPNEPCLISFRSIWSPNSRQELGGRCFLTEKHIYIYMNALGFVALFKGRVDQLVSVESVSQSDYDILRIYNMNGVIKMKLFLDDAVALKRKITYLIENNIKDTPDTKTVVIDRILEIDTQRKLESLKAEQSLLNKEPFPSVDSSPQSVETISPDKVSSEQMNVDFSKESTYISSHTYNLPAKAIFHILLGDDSILFRELSPIARLQSVSKKSWNTDPQGKLFRKFNATVTYYTRKRAVIQFQQRIDEMRNDEYYTFTHSKSKFKLLIGSPFGIKYRVVIISMGKQKSRVFIYGAPEFEGKSPVLWLTKAICSQFTQSDVRSLHRAIGDAEKAIGTHGQVVKAIYMYGKLTRSTYAEDTPDVEATYFGLLSALRLVFHRAMLLLLRFSALFIHFLANAIITLIKGIRMNQFIIILLVGSGLLNLCMLGKTTQSYWHARRVSKIASEFLASDPWVLQRAVYIKDTEDMLQVIRTPESMNDSRCFDMFKKTSFSLNHERYPQWNAEYGDADTREVARNLKKSLQEIGIKRNELLVNLKMLNSMEEEIAQGEWKNWLLSEIQRCEYVMESDMEVNDEGVDQIIEYCRGCTSELQHLSLL
ncbi:membrane-anchored lipid-binding protein Sip3p [[Candida] anglica]|uniref:Membrane-anchored lipid-binding protein Sip3p n=1 Tax=[Candida] anglica TaxID=148631 RepID=A0ABP0EHA2_9ASCO